MNMDVDILPLDKVHVEVVDQHVVEDAATGAEVLQGRQRVVAAAGLHYLAPPMAWDLP